MSEICSSKDEIMSRVANIPGLKLPTVVYLAVADALVQDGSIRNAWREGLVAVIQHFQACWCLKGVRRWREWVTDLTTVTISNLAASASRFYSHRCGARNNSINIVFDITDDGVRWYSCLFRMC
ncbi:hypothetical protein Hanom_Chr16g01459501 [Helianthus anomalus]